MLRRLAIRPLPVLLCGLAALCGCGEAITGAEVPNAPPETMVTAAPPQTSATGSACSTATTANRPI